MNVFLLERSPQEQGNIFKLKQIKEVQTTQKNNRRYLNRVRSGIRYCNRLTDLNQVLTTTQ